MNLSDSALLGYVSILVGLALGLMGIAVLVNLREEGRQEEGSQEPELPLEEAEKEEELRGEEEHRAERELLPASSDLEEVQAPVGERERITLSRSKLSGRLHIEVEGRRYRSAEEMQSSSDWALAEVIYQEWRGWFSPDPESDTAADSEAPTESQRAVEPQTPTMIEAINLVLRRKLEAAEGETRGIHLQEGPGGTVKVYIGVESFPIDEVPYEEVRQIIAEAVEEWEKSQ
jgi:hypothetical protein